MTNNFITNKKETAAAIKAAVDQANKVKKLEEIKVRNEKRNQLEFEALINWKKDFEKRWLK